MPDIAAGKSVIVLPAYAGMIPPLSFAVAALARAPRVCGDDP